MSIWLLAGLALVVESIVLTWVWALCRAAAIGDYHPTLGSIRAHSIRSRLTEVDSDEWVHLAPSSEGHIRNAATIA